ncbi:hypothetical protein [Streptomyces sp. M2CJ-2]|uniref:hypothetical protein n=1 Tax=Streptomyces sp. M2CJ-2 TaxID=2803948 RepID=UPI001F263991|nr:hypothetical protein [Streptomyces sp. M2CJ-2]
MTGPSLTATLWSAATGLDGEADVEGQGMKRLYGLGVAIAAGTAALLLTGCNAPTDYSEIVTFTDEHGRVCTAAVVVDQEQNKNEDYEISSLDCDYPPEGQTPGPTRYSPLPERDAK